jgi:hypothetical protein
MDRLKETLMSMGIDAKSIPETSNYTTTKGISLKDADTLVTPETPSLRLQGINAAETAKFMPGNIKGAQPGADLQTELVRQTIEQGDYSATKPFGKEYYNRNLGDLYSPGGRSLTNELLYKGYVDTSKDATEEQRLSQAYGALDRRQRALELKTTKADDLFNQLVNEQNPTGSFKAKMFTPSAKSFNQADTEYFIGPSVIRPGEDYKGETTDQISTGLDIGTAQMKKGFWGSMELLGEKTGADWLKDTATSNVRMHQSTLENLPYLRSAEAFGENGEWKLDTFGKVFDFAIGQAASSAPQMLTTIVSTLAAPITFGASLSVPASIYIGQTWNGQKEGEKSATAAILAGTTMTALDKLGLKGFSPKGLDITKPGTQAIVKNELLKKYSSEVADQMILKATKESVREVAQVLRLETIKQSTGIKEIGKQILKGAATEGPTEGLQEIVGYLGENVTFNPIPSTTEEQNKLKNRLANAVVGGAILGGSFGGAGAAIRTVTQSKELIEQNSDSDFRRKWLMDNNASQVFSTNQILQQAFDGMSERPTLAKMAEAEVTKRMVTGKLQSFIADKGFKGLWGKWSDVIMKGMSHQDEYMATLSTLLGASKAANGMSIDEHQKLLEANIFNNFGTKEDIMSSFQGLSTEQASLVLTDPKVVDEIIRISQEKQMTGTASSADMAKSIGFDFGKHSQYSDGILKYADKITNLVKAYNDATQQTLTVREFLSKKPLDKTKVSRYSGDFIKDLMDVYKLTSSDATKIVDSILNNPDVQDVSDSINDLLNPSLAKDLQNKNELTRMLNDPDNSVKFSKYFSNDLLDNAYALASRGSAINTNVNLIGPDGNKLAGLIQQSLSRGNIDSDTAAFMAQEIKDYLDIRTGKYRPPLNPYLRGALNTINFLATITSLPLAAISSTVEFAQVYRNLNKPQSMKATKLLLNSFGKEFSALFRELGTHMSDKVDAKVSPQREALSRAGYLREGGIGHRADVMSGYFQSWTEGFFKVTGLTSITAVTRNAKLGIAADAVKNWIDVVKESDNNLDTQAARDAYDHLVRLGVDVEFVTSEVSDNAINKQKFDNMMQLATYNFINEAVVVPSQLNRPKFYSDPYLRLFTQFQGYTSTFTANILPRLVGDLGRAGSADQKNAAATIAMMFALSLLALYIKDIIKYGESPPEWLKDEKQFQRVVGQMGVLGTGQRVWDTIDPMFEGKRSKDIMGSVWNAVSEQSPQLSYINKVNSFLSEIPKDNGKEIEKGARLLPIFGTSPAFAKYLQKELGE